MHVWATARFLPRRGPSCSLAEPPPDVVALAQQRATARGERDFAAADRLRDEIAAIGWVVTDAPGGGFTLAEQPPYDVLPSVRELPDNSTVVDTRRGTVSVIVDGWPEDTRTCLGALLSHLPDDVVVQVLDVGNVDGAGDVVAELVTPRMEAWHVTATTGWADARNALLRADTARIHVWCELSTVFTGDALGPLLDAIDADDAVVGAGWQGVNVDVDDQWRSFAAAGPGEVDALLGYLFAMRRSAALAAGGAHPKARYYRNADMEFSFALRDAVAGSRLVVPAADLPLRQDRHRGYHDADPGYRDKESAKTYQRFLRRFRGRTDLLAPRQG
jgi:hypothetical protein